VHHAHATVNPSNPRWRCRLLRSAAFGWAGSRNSGSAAISDDGDIPVNKVTTAIGEEPDSATSRVSALAANPLRRAGFDRNDASISLVSGRIHREMALSRAVRFVLRYSFTGPAGVREGAAAKTKHVAA